MAKEIQTTGNDEKRAAELDRMIREETDDLHHGKSMAPTVEEIRKRNILKRIKDRI